MIISKKIQKEIKRPYFFYEGKFENIDSNYFINKIEEAIIRKDNQSYKTNLQGCMTDWEFFVNDLKFKKLIWQLFDVIDRDFKPKKYYLRDAWGLKTSMGDYTTQHDHTRDNIFISGVIYLNEHNQILEFPEINQQVKPGIGKFAIFSSFLHHGCNRNLINTIKYGLSFNISYI